MATSSRASKTWGAVFAAVVLMAPAVVGAADTWSDPFPGVRYLYRTTPDPLRIHVLEVNLCAAGIELRATRSSEKGRTTSSFGTLVDAEAAINGDFYSSGYNTSGLAMGAGELWPGSTDPGHHGFVAFGERDVYISHPVEVFGPPSAWMRDIVGGVPEVVIDGQPILGHTGPLCTDRHPRTVVGLSQDQRTLWLAVVDGRSTSSRGMNCNELANLMHGLGAHTALNLDGGGSSTMWIKQQGVVNQPSDGSQRVVANHLAVFAKGAGAARSCVNLPPTGYLDEASCTSLRGWARDEDLPHEAVGVELRLDAIEDGTTSSGIVLADQHRADLCDALSSCTHAFDTPSPLRLRDGRPYRVSAFAIDPDDRSRAELHQSPLELTCPRWTPTGMRRWITSPASFETWRFSLFFDLLALDDDTLATLDEGPEMPLSPTIVRRESDGSYWLIDGPWRRPLSAAHMSTWRFEEHDAVNWSEGELTALGVGPPVPDELVLVKGSDAPLYVLDDWRCASGGAPPCDENDFDPGDGGADSTGGGDETGGDAGSRALPDEPTDGSGCSCTSSGTTARPLGALVLGLLPLGRRRRRARSRERLGT